MPSRGVYISRKYTYVTSGARDFRRRVITVDQKNSINVCTFICLFRKRISFKKTRRIVLVTSSRRSRSNSDFGAFGSFANSKKALINRDERMKSVRSRSDGLRVPQDDSSRIIIDYDRKSFARLLVA